MIYPKLRTTAALLLLSLSMGVSAVSAHTETLLPESCKLNLEEAESILAAGETTVKKISVTEIRGYSNVPEGSSLKIEFVVNTLPTERSVYTNTAEKFQNCEKVGLVTIGKENSSEIVSVGRVGETMQAFRCASNIPRQGLLDWGLEICGR